MKNSNALVAPIVSTVVTKIGKNGRPYFVSPKKTAKKEATPVTVETTPETSATPVEATVTPVEEKKVLFGRKLGAKDAYGYGSETEASFIASGIASGKFTRPELLASFLSRFSPKAEATGDVKAKKTSFSVFLSDLRRPFGTYYASRSAIVLVSETGKLSFEPTRDDRIREAIGSGILDRIRGVKGSKLEAILGEYELPIK